MTPRLFPALALLAAGFSPAVALAAEDSDQQSLLVVYGDDPCPAGTGDEIVVCARKPESERYRIPKALRSKAAVVGGPGWASQVATMDQVSRQLLPNSCSPIGSNGFTGCTMAMLRQWHAERQLDGQLENARP
jgi:hypothetical protein